MDDITVSSIGIYFYTNDDCYTLSSCKELNEIVVITPNKKQMPNQYICCEKY